MDPTDRAGIPAVSEWGGAAVHHAASDARHLPPPPGASLTPAPGSFTYGGSVASNAAPSSPDRSDGTSRSLPLQQQLPPPPTTPERRRATPVPRGTLSPVSDSSLGGDSPERTPGPGEQSPDAREMRQGCDVSSLLLEAEERSNRRVQAIQGVLAGLRGGVVEGRSVCNDDRQPPPWPRTPPLPLLPSCDGLGNRSDSTDAARVGRASADRDDEPLEPRAPPPPTAAPAPLPVSSDRGVARRLPFAPASTDLPNTPAASPASTASAANASSMLDGFPDFSRPSTLGAAASATWQTNPMGGAASSNGTRHEDSGACVGDDTEVRSPRRNRMAAYCKGLEERLERRLDEQRQALDRSMATCETEREAAQEAQEALLKAEANAAFIEGTATKREAQLRAELLEMRSEHQKDRERLRSETRRLQNTIKDMQGRAKAEQDSRSSCAEELENLRQQMAAGKAEMQRRSREGSEARAALAALEKRVEQNLESFRWLIARCAEALGEDAAHALQSVGGNSEGAASLGPDALEDGMKRVVGRTLTLLRRRAHNASDSDKENVGKAASHRAGSPNAAAAAACGFLQASAAESTAQRLATAQNELLQARAESEELEQKRNMLQERLEESEQELQAAAFGLRKSTSSGLRTEHRGRIRELMDEQRRLQIQMCDLEHRAGMEKEEHEEECERLRGKLATLQRAKEGGERYIETEEDAWAEAKALIQASEASVASMRAELRRAEVDARHAKADAVEARVAAHAEEASKRRLEADLESVRATARAPKVADPSGELEELRLEKARLQAELSRRTEASAHEMSTAQSSVAQWRDACLRAEDEASSLRGNLSEERAALRFLQSRARHLAQEEEERETHRAKVDEAKRTILQEALEEQARSLKNEYTEMLDSANARFETEAETLQECLAERNAHQVNLDRARQSVLRMQQEASVFEDDVRQRMEALTVNEELLCARSRVELQSAREAEQTASREAEERAMQNAREDAERHAQREVEAALAAAASAHERTLAELKSAHRAKLGELREEHQIEGAALRQMEVDTRRHFEMELDAAVRDRQSLEKAVKDAVRRETEEAMHARQALRTEELAAQASVHEQRAEIQAAVRQRLFEELHQEATEDVRKDVLENPCSALRRALCRDLRQELRDQMRSEQRSSEQRSNEMNNSPRSSVASFGVLPAAPRVQEASWREDTDTSHGLQRQLCQSENGSRSPRYPAYASTGRGGCDSSNDGYPVSAAGTRVRYGEAHATTGGDRSVSRDSFASTAGRTPRHSSGFATVPAAATGVRYGEAAISEIAGGEGSASRESFASTSGRSPRRSSGLATTPGGMGSSATPLSSIAASGSSVALDSPATARGNVSARSGRSVASSATASGAGTWPRRELRGAFAAAADRMLPAAPAGWATTGPSVPANASASMPRSVGEASPSTDASTSVSSGAYPMSEKRPGALPRESSPVRRVPSLALGGEDSGARKPRQQRIVWTGDVDNGTTTGDRGDLGTGTPASNPLESTRSAPGGPSPFEHRRRLSSLLQGLDKLEVEVEGHSVIGSARTGSTLEEDAAAVLTRITQASDAVRSRIGTPRTTPRSGTSSLLGSTQ